MEMGVNAGGEEPKNTFLPTPDRVRRGFSGLEYTVIVKDHDEDTDTYTIQFLRDNDDRFTFDGVPPGEAEAFEIGSVHHVDITVESPS